MNKVTTTQENILQTLFKLEAENERLHDVFDKIKAEIERMDYLDIEDGSDGYDKYVDRYEVLQIIDKYKAES